MKLKEIGIKNFRGYKAEKRVPVDADVTGITGRNDVGKSTILEALDIFFPGGETTIDKDDFNVSEPDGSVEIRCIFDELPAEIIIDEANKTTLGEEHLLNANGDLEILKRYKRSSKEPSIYIVAAHPSKVGTDDLHTLKITDLKKRAKELGVTDAELADQFGIPWATLLDSDLGTPEEQKNRDAIAELQKLGKKAYITKKREPENYILPEVVAPFIKVGGTVAYTDTDDAKKIIGAATVKRQEDVLEKFWQLMTAEQIRRAEKYVDDKGAERFELTEILSDLLTLV